MHHFGLNLLVYEFLFDRFRSIRQDLIVQGTPDLRISRNILEYSIKFHLLANYKLGSYPLEPGFDKEMNFKQLLECLKALLTLCDVEDPTVKEFIGIYLMLNLGSIGNVV